MNAGPADAGGSAPGVVTTAGPADAGGSAGGAVAHALRADAGVRRAGASRRVAGRRRRFPHAGTSPP